MYGCLLYAMKYVILLFAFQFFVVLSCAQSGGGFSRIYTLGDNANYASNFTSVLMKGDTIIAYGNAYISASVPYTSVALAKLDTFGHLLDRTFFYLGNDDLLTADGNNIIRLGNGGYAGVSTTFTGHQASVTIFDEGGAPLSNKIYGVNGIFTLIARRILEMPDGGILIGGVVQKFDYSLENFVKRIDPSGNQLWSRAYGEALKNDIVQSLIKADDNTFVVGGGRVSPQGTPIPDTWGKSWIFAIDSMGLMKWEWFSPINEEVTVAGLHQTEGGRWIYLTATHEIISADKTGNRIKVVRRDSNFNLLWERVLSPLGPSINQLGDLSPTPDGNWIASGTWAYKTGPGQDDITFYNCIFKLNDQGDTLWSVRLKAPLGYDGLSYPGGLAVLPSGSAIWALWFDRYEPAPAQSFGWLIKVDNDGCVDTLCQMSGLSPELPPVATVPVQVYPNPAHNEVTFEMPELTTPALIKTFDYSGNLLWVHEFHNKAVWQTQNLPAGLYFYTLSSDKFKTRSGKITVIH